MKPCRWLRFLWISIPLFRAFGVPVQVHSTTLLFPWGLLLWVGWAEAELRGLVASVVLVGLVCSSILVHEFAHVLAARCWGWRTRRVLLIPLGCVADLEDMPQEPGEIWMALAGPLASAVLGFLAWGGRLLIGWPHDLCALRLREFLDLAIVFNLGVAGFNLLPCFPMDGGRVLRSSLAILIGVLCPRQAGNAFLLATRISVRYVARVVVVTVIFVTFFYTHLWHHLLLFGLLMLAGEAEFFALREMSLPTSAPLELHFRPVHLQAMPRPARVAKGNHADGVPFLEVFVHTVPPRADMVQR